MNVKTSELLCARTREGNDIYPAGCGIRETIRGNSNSICADCIHVADMCKGMNKRNQNVDGYIGVGWCSGFEPVST